jgi:hypothetical protein
MQTLRGRVTAQRRKNGRASAVPAAYASYARNLFEAEPAPQRQNESAVAYAPFADVSCGAPGEQMAWMRQEGSRLNRALKEHGMMEIGAARIALREPGATQIPAANQPRPLPSDANIHTPSAKPLRLLSEAGPVAYEALLAVLRGTEAHTPLHVGPLAKGTPLRVAVLACRDALCGVPGSVFELAAACTLRVSDAARLENTSLTGSQQLLQRFSDTGTRLRRLDTVADHLTRVHHRSAAAQAMGNALHTYLRMYRLQVRKNKDTGVQTAKRVENVCQGERAVPPPPFPSFPWAMSIVRLS